MNGEIKRGMKEEAWKLCKNFLSGPWKDTSLEEFRLYEVRGGLSNTLYRCVLPERAALNNPKVPKDVLLRIYGALQEDANVIVKEAIIFMLLSERNLGPKLYGVFPKGRLEEFVPSHSLSRDEVRKYSPFIARELAKIHALEVPVRKVPDIFKIFVTKWLSEVQDIIESDDDNSFMSVEDYRRQIQWISAEMEQTDSPVVFCHNDLLGGNILYREDSIKNENPNLMLIDFEFGAYNYRGFDIANHFCEWCLDYNTPIFPHFEFNIEKFPSRQEQDVFFSAYLDQLVKEGVQLKSSVQEEKEKMMREWPIFACAANIMWSLWSLKMSIITTDGFGHKKSDQSHPHKKESESDEDQHWKKRMESTFIAAVKEHSRTRRELFQDFKERYLATTMER